MADDKTKRGSLDSKRLNKSGPYGVAYARSKRRTAAKKAGARTSVARTRSDLLDEADIEHASAKDLVAQIEASHFDDDHYDAKAEVLSEYITHHVVEEHTEMFTRCRRSGMDLLALRAALEERKMSLPPEACRRPAGRRTR